jgi:hypothetical protein
MFKTDNYTFQEYADIGLVLDDACGHGAAAVRLYMER